MSSLKTFISIYLSCFPFILFAQLNLDSLDNLLPTSKGSEKVDLLNTITWEVKFSDSDRALKLIKESIDLARTISYTQGEAQALYQLAAFDYLKGNISNSLENSKKSITLFEGINNSLGLAKNWNLSGLNLQRLNDFSGALEYYDKAQTTCELFGYDEMMRNVLTNKANISFEQGDYQKALDEYQLLSSSYLENGDTATYYIALFNLAKSQHKLGLYSEALSNFFKIKSFEKTSNRPLYLANTFNEIGSLYLKLGIGEQTLEMFEKANELYQQLGNRRKVGMVNMSFGIYFFDHKDFEKSEFFYKKALHISDSLSLNFSGKIYNNIASLKIETNQFEEALSLLDQSLEINKTNENKQLLLSNYVNMGAAYFGLEQIQQSEQYYLKAFNLSTEIGDIFVKQQASEGLAEIYQLTNNNKDFEYYSTMAKVTNDSLFNKQKLLEINRLLVTNLHEEHQNKTKELGNELSATKEQLALLKNKNNSFFYRYKLLLICLFTCFAIGLVWILKRQKRTALLNQTLKNKAIEDQEKFEISIENKNKQLTLLSLETAQQTEVLKKIHDSLQHIISKNPENLEIKKLEKLLTTQTLDQHNWENFASYFNEVYIGFFDRLSKSFPSITNKELRLCALIRLKIPTYEASIILGISPRSVHKSRYRIRKKMGLDSEVNMDEFICSI